MNTTKVPEFQSTRVTLMIAQRVKAKVPIGGRGVKQRGLEHLLRWAHQMVIRTNEAKRKLGIKTTAWRG